MIQSSVSSSENALNFTTLLDDERALAILSFSDVVTSEDIDGVSSWGQNELIPWIKERDVRGIIFDFRKATRFAFGTLGSAVNANYSIKEKAKLLGVDFDLIPLVHVVLSTRLEKTIRMFSLPSKSNLRLVTRGTDEALKFINQCNLEEGRQFDLPDDLLNSWPEL